MIWRDPDEVVFDDAFLVRVAPLAVMEWKARTSRIFAPDVEWLRSFTALHSGTLGVAVSVAFAPVVVVRAVFVEMGFATTETVISGARL